MLTDPLLHACHEEKQWTKANVIVACNRVDTPSKDKEAVMPSHKALAV